MKIENLHLEITRNCTLECEHCLRGNRQQINMNPKLLNQIFINLNQVDNLLLTGGEPFLAIEVIEKLIDLLKTKKVRIKKLTIITNGTVLNDKIMTSLKELTNYTYLILLVSTNIFHQLEVDRLNLRELRDKNIKIIEDANLVAHVNCNYGKEINLKRKAVIYKLGSAKKLTRERLMAINTVSFQEYVFSNEVITHPETCIRNNKIHGNITIDVYGNIVHASQSFEDEDKEAKEYNINIVDMTLEAAVNTFINILAKENSSKINDFESDYTNKKLSLQNKN